MDWIERLKSESCMRLIRTGLPRRILRHLIFTHHIGVGSRILDVGCGRGDLVRFFNQLGFKASGIDERYKRVAVGLRETPTLDLKDGSLDELITTFDEKFDLIIIRQYGDYQNYLFSPNSFDTTAKILSLINPGGALVFLQKREYGSEYEISGHVGECFQKHLDNFPVDCQIADFPDKILHRKTVRRLFSKRPRAGYFAATVFVDEKTAQNPEKWQYIADAASLKFRVPCCIWSAERFIAERKQRPAA